MTQIDHHHSPVQPGVDRRTLLRSAGLGIVFLGSVEAITGCAPAAAPAPAPAAPPAPGYGPLVADPKKLLALPDGFSYQLIGESGSTSLSDGGEPTPSDPDGTAAFPNGAGVTLINNHEIGEDEPFRVPTRPDLTYDPAAGGGTTNVEVNAMGARTGEYVSLAGTNNNCAGGPTPWGTWLTCEETEDKAGEKGMTKDHGFVFEVSPIAAENPGNSPVPLRYLGRYAHEAVAIDPSGTTIYLTEDANEPHGLLYRWTAPAGFTPGKGALQALARTTGDGAGTLQAMRAKQDGQVVKDLSEITAAGTSLDVEWVDVPDRLASTTPTRKQFPDDQISRSRKFEGASWGDGGAYIVASFARAKDGSVKEHDGQIWHVDPATNKITLRTIFAVNTNAAQDGVNFDGPDNITINPHGGVVISEDGEGVQHLLGVGKDGVPYAIARNDVNDSEFAGPTFSPDGKFLFAGIQDPGYVFSITGPWTGKA